MRTTTRLAATLLILASPALTFPAEAGSGRIASRIKQALHHASPGASADAPQAQPQSGCDPYGFAAILNAHRASAGLPPLSYDPGLSAWAGRNNAAQCLRGIGHHINPNCFQNCAWNHATVREVAQGWMRSPGHRRNMLSPSATRFGIAHGPGPYWTLNAK